MDNDDGWQSLDGGTTSTVGRKGDVVRRRLRPTSPGVHALLVHLERQGYEHSPRFLGVEGDYEFLSYVHGDCQSASQWDGSDDRALTRAAEILRTYHDAAESFRWDGYEWTSTFHRKDHEDLVTHNDFGIHNCVFVDGLPHAMIDFDEAAPGTREWDLAYTLYMFVPVHAQADFGDAPRKFRLLCDAYGLEDRSTIIETLIERVARSTEAAHEYIRMGGPAARLGNRVLRFSKLGLMRLENERTRLQEALR